MMGGVALWSAWDNAVASCGLGAGRELLQAVVGVVEHVQQHGQIEAGNEPEVLAASEFGGDIAGRGAEHVSEYQYLLIDRELGKQGQAAFADGLWGVVWAHCQVERAHGVLAKNIDGSVQKGLANLAVTDKEEADAHGLGFRVVGDGAG